MDDDRIAALERELNALYYSISHDLRAPLRAIDGFSQAVLEDYGTRLDEEGRAYLERVCAAAKRMTAMIDGLLQISRLNRDPLDRRDIDLAITADEVVAELRQLDTMRTVVWEHPASLPAFADAHLARTLLAALLDNAWKFTRHTAAARVSFTRTGEIFTVGDNGAGFDPARAARLFSPFQRLHTPEEFPGVGLGLAAAARIVSRHGGRIWADATPGEGAQFHFTLPAPRGEPNAER